MAREQTKDRRVQRTRRLLRDALGSLIHEKSYDAIAVKEILARADVGRSAFYNHFAGKDALLVSGIQEMLHERSPRALPPPAQRFAGILWFSLPVLEHIGRLRRAGSVMEGRDRAAVHQHLREVLVETIAGRVERLPRHRAAVPPELLTEYVAATFVLVLDWWVGSGSTLSALEVDDLYLSMVVPTLAAMEDG